MQCLSPSFLSWLSIYVPCGACTQCQSHWRWIWTQKVRLEAAAAKSWFVTLTYDEDHVSACSYADVQKWLKRVRDANGYKTLRYFCVYEEGAANGRPHWHLVIHGDFLWRHVSHRWYAGFEQIRLVRDDHVRYRYQGKTRVRALAKYLAKYLTKTKEKPRCSKSYGFQPIETLRSHPLVSTALETFGGSCISAVRPSTGTVISLPYRMKKKTRSELPLGWGSGCQPQAERISDLVEADRIATYYEQHDYDHTQLGG